MLRMYFLLFSAVLFVFNGNADAVGRLDHYRVHERKRPSMPPLRRRNNVKSLEDCAALCESLSSIRCTMFSLRKRGMRCLMYSDRQMKSISSDFEDFINAIGFTTFEFDEDPGTRLSTASNAAECVDEFDVLQVNYRGTQSKTASGLTCQKWTKNKPHRPAYRPSNPAEHHNYCRNPDKDSKGVWCYTTKKRVRWEYCSVPKCSEITTTTKKPTTTSPKVVTTPTNNPTTTSRKVVTTTEPVPEPCFVCNGYDYRGNLNRTASRKTCQRWDASVPHQHSNHPSQKPGRHLEENFCRNPDGDVKPWCYTTDPKTRWEYCGAERCTNRDGSVLVPSVPTTVECVTGSGGNYRGTVSVTKSGRRCAPWTSQSPHKHTKTPENYPCSGLERNYCRNPSANFDEGPWCFTTDSSTRWETCNIPKCGPDGRPVTPTTTTTVTTSTPGTTTAPGACGTQIIEPYFVTQPFNIVDDEIVSTTRRRRSAYPQERILGGDIAIHGSWPWSVSLRFNDVHFCGGTLIKRSWVLTASHCLDDNSNVAYLSVKVGHQTGSEPQLQMRKFLRYILHAHYSKRNVKNDIALVQVKHPFDITDYVRLACLPPPDYIVPGNNYCIVTGWGNTYDPKYQNQLKQAVLPIHSYYDCLRYMGSHMRDKTQMCAGYKGQGHDTCRGDSGGPLSCLNNGRWTVQGVTSWGSGCENRKGSYGSYTRVSKYITWINNNIQRYG